jgi:hypothetical protein
MSMVERILSSAELTKFFLCNQCTRTIFLQEICPVKALTKNIQLPVTCLSDVSIVFDLDLLYVQQNIGHYYCAGYYEMRVYVQFLSKYSVFICACITISWRHFAKGLRIYFLT